MELKGTVDLNVVVVHERWPGATGQSAFNALLRAGAKVHSLAEAESIPLQWRSRSLRVVGRLLRPMAVKEFNRILEETCRRIPADLLVVFKGTFVEWKAIRRLRRAGVRCVCVYPDVSFTVHGPYLRETLPEYDWVFTTKTFGIEDLRTHLGMTRASLLRHAFDPEVHRQMPVSARMRDRIAADVSFVGTWSPKKERLLAAVAEECGEARLRIFGAQWERARANRALARSIEGYPVSGAAYAETICATKVNLGLLSERRPGASDGDAITSRTFHIPAAGGFLLHERTAELSQILTEGVECEAFDGPDELVAKVRWALSDDAKRTAIAEAGRLRVWQSHSWDERVQEMIEKLIRVGLLTEDEVAGLC